VHLAFISTFEALKKRCTEFIQNPSVRACDNEIIYVSSKQDNMTFLDNRPHAALETYQGASLTLRYALIV